MCEEPRLEAPRCERQTSLLTYQKFCCATTDRRLHDAAACHASFEHGISSRQQENAASAAACAARWRCYAASTSPALTRSSLGRCNNGADPLSLLLHLSPPSSRLDPTPALRQAARGGPAAPQRHHGQEQGLAPPPGRADVGGLPGRPCSLPQRHGAQRQRPIAHSAGGDAPAYRL